MSMSEKARALLAERGVPAHTSEVLTCRQRLEGLRAELARVEQRVSWWDRAVFFHTTADEARQRALRAELGQAEARYAAALGAWRAAVEACSAYAPIDIVYRVELVIFDVLADRAVGRDKQGGQVLAATLDAIADRLVATWLPGVDLVELAARVPDDQARRQALIAPPGAAARHPELGWAPVTGDELFSRVAHALETCPEFAAAKASLARELHEDDSFRAALEHARSQVTLADKVAPWRREREQVVARLESELAREEHETELAIDVLRLAVVRAFAAHPIAWLHFALVGAAAALRAARPTRELVVDGSGDAEQVASGSGRAVVLACLVEVRRALEYAFPGVPGQVWPRGRQTVAASPAPEGPYRVGAVVDAAPTPEEVADAERALFAELDAGQVRVHLTRAVAVATVLGVVERHSARTEVTWLDRLAFWSDTADEIRKDNLDSRAVVHGEGLARHGSAALGEVAAAALTHHPLVGLGQALAYALETTEAIQTAGGRSSSPRHCPTTNKAEAQRWLERLEQTMVRFFAVAGSRGQWVDDICRRIGQATGPIRPPERDELTAYPAVIELAAAQLQSTNFVALAAHAWQMREQLTEATRAREAAAGRVSFWDKVNVFSDTEDERLRDVWQARAREVRGSLGNAESEMNRLLDAALAAHPPLLLYEALLEVGRAVAAIRAQSERRTVTHTQRNSKGHVISRRTETYYVCVLYGQSEAEARLRRWADRALEVFGPLPTASDALEAWITREL